MNSWKWVRTFPAAAVRVRVMLVECERKYGRVEKFGRNWHGCPMMSRKSFQPISSILDFDFFKSYQLQPCESCSCNVSEKQQDADDLWMFGIGSNQEMHESCLKPIMVIEWCRCFDWSDWMIYGFWRLCSSELAEQLSKISFNIKIMHINLVLNYQSSYLLM